MSSQYKEMPITLVLIAIAEAMKLFDEPYPDKPLQSSVQANLEIIFPGFVDSEELTAEERDQAYELRDLFLRLIGVDYPSEPPH